MWRQAAISASGKLQRNHAKSMLLENSDPGSCYIRYVSQTCTCFTLVKFSRELERGRLRIWRQALVFWLRKQEKAVCHRIQAPVHDCQSSVVKCERQLSIPRHARKRSGYTWACMIRNTSRTSSSSVVTGGEGSVNSSWLQKQNRSQRNCKIGTSSSHAAPKC